MIGSIANAVRKRVGSTNYVFGTIPSDKLRQLTFVPVIEPSRKTFLNEDSTEGYQRPASLSRMRAFMRFLREHPNSVVPPILISGRGAWKFVPTAEGAELGGVDIEGPAAIIDGQHRAGGFVAFFETDEAIRDVAFILLEGLPLDLEKEEFLVVNNTQKGVPKSLTAYLEDSEEAQIAWALNTEDDSPFKGRIARTGMGREQLFALHSVARQMKRLFSLGALQDLDVETKVEFASRFFTIVADSLPDEWSDLEKLDDPDSKGKSSFEYKLLELTGLIAWSICGAQILHRSYSEETGMNWDNVARLVNAAADVDWPKDGQYAGRTGEAGGKVIADDMLRKLPAEAAAASTAE